MRIQLFNDKQVTKLVESIQRQFVVEFNKAKDELEALLDAETKRQVENNVDIQEYIEKRKTNLELVLQLVELNKQVEALDDSYYINTSKWRSTRISGFEQESYDKKTQDTINDKADTAAEKALGLDDIDYREKCLNDDIIARVAVMNVTDYDNIVTLLNTKIKIKNYFVTL
jgi:hypothetical protein